MSTLGRTGMMTPNGFLSDPAGVNKNMHPQQVLYNQQHQTIDVAESQSYQLQNFIASHGQKRGGSPVSALNGVDDYGGSYGPRSNFNNAQGAPIARNTQNGFFSPGNQKTGGHMGGGLYPGNPMQNPMSHTGYHQPNSSGGFGQLRNKSNAAKLSQYQGVHGTIVGPNLSMHQKNIMDPHQINNLPVENSNITPQEVAAYYANALNAKQIINQRRAHGQGKSKR